MANLTTTDAHFLDMAGKLAQDNVRQGLGGPFGAVIVDSGGQVVAAACNAVISTNDPTAHAEVQAIRSATSKLGRYDLTGLTIYASAEPCPMCMAAIYWARLARVVYSNTRQQTAAIGFDDAFFYDELLKQPHQRQLTCQHAPNPEAEAAFKLWADSNLPRY